MFNLNSSSSFFCPQRKQKPDTIPLLLGKLLCQATGRLDAGINQTERPRHPPSCEAQAVS